MKRLFVGTAALTLILGTALVLLPEPMLSLWGASTDQVGLFFARRQGGMFFGYAVILWLSRQSESSPARTAILAGGAVVTGVMAVISLIGIVTGVVGLGFLPIPLIEVLLATGFSYFYVSHR